MAWITHGNASGEGVVSIGTQAWNIADGYTKIKILRIIIQLDIDEEIAMFGRKDDIEMIDPQSIPERRVEAFNKYIFHLKQLMGNCEFAIRDPINKTIFVNIKRRIENVEAVANGIADYMINDVTKENELRINYDHFQKCFNSLMDIKNEINFPINREGLIFKQSDELDLDDIMKDIEDGGS
jgi:hypothetical protein